MTELQQVPHIFVHLSIRVVARTVSEISEVMVSEYEVVTLLSVKVWDRGGASVQVSADQHTFLGLEAANFIVEL